MSENIVEMRNITKRYGNAIALNDVSMTIKRGQIYGLVGNNGAGKTTLMRLIAGHTMVDEGSIHLFDQIGEKNLRNARKRTGVLIEEPGFYQNMTAEQNLEYFRIQFGIPGKHVVKDVLEQVGLGDTGKKTFKQFSLGMRQRMGIALALLHTPELLILDEPINGLDPSGIIEIRQMLLELNKKHNTTILISSHILAELTNVVTQYGFLSHGHLIEEISADALAKKCLGYLDISVDQPNEMCMLLEKDLGLKDFKVYPNKHIHLYEGMDKGNKICELAVKHNINLYGIGQQKMSLENYYMDMVEGC